MAVASKLYVNGQERLLKDGEARAKAAAALEAAALLRSKSIGQFKGRSLAVQFASEILGFDNEWAWLKDRASRGDFDGLMIGDYLDVTLSSGFQMRYRVAAIDPYYNVGDTPMGHNIAMVPDQTVPVTGSYAVNGNHIQWNKTNTNNGNSTENSPYIASNLHKWEEEVFKPMLPQMVRDAILPRRFLIETRFSTAGAQSNPTSWAWKTAEIWSLDEVEALGRAVWAVSGYAQASSCHFPLFDTWADIIRDQGGDRVHWWLRVPGSGSATWVCYVDADGYGSCSGATNTYLRPLPCFLIG